MLGGVGALLAFAFIGLQIALFIGGISYRKDCLTNEGAVKSSWTFTWFAPIPYLFRPSEDGCEVHTGTRVALNAIGIGGFDKPTTVSLAKKLSSKTNDPNLAYFGRLKAFVIESQQQSASVESLGQAQRVVDRLIGQLNSFSPPPKYADVHDRLVSLYVAQRRYGRQMQKAAAASNQAAYAAAAKRIDNQQGETQAILEEINRLHATD